MQVRRILESATFQGSPQLKAFLEFVTTEALEGRAGNISEYAIATRVFGRRDDFDPTSATVVRTQAYRLRRKLAEYYQEEGAADAILVDIPKGHYYPAFSTREVTGPPKAAVAVNGSAGPSTRLVLGALLLFASGVTTGWVVFGRSGPPAAQALPGGAVGQFWGSLARPGQPIVVGYTNPVYLINTSGDLFLPRGAPAGVRGEMVPKDALKPPLRLFPGPFYFEDGFTGTGEVPAVHRLTSLLEKSGIPVLVKRSRTVTVEDLRNHDVVFLGSGSATQALQNVKFLQRFQFQSPDSGPGLWRNSIVDHDAGPGQRRSYVLERDPATQSLRTDYAVFAVLPGVIPARRVVLMAGLSTSGTQGAAEYATSEHHLRRLLRALVPQGGEKAEFPRYFEAVLRVDVAKGLDAVNSTFVAGGPVSPSH